LDQDLVTWIWLTLLHLEPSDWILDTRF